MHYVLLNFVLLVNTSRISLENDPPYLVLGLRNRQGI